MIYSIIISSIYASVTELKKTKGFWVFQGCAAVDGKKKRDKTCKHQFSHSMGDFGEEGYFEGAFLNIFQPGRDGGCP